TEQVRQTGVACSVMLTDAGKTPEAVTNLISSLTLTNLIKEDADKIADKIGDMPARDALQFPKDFALPAGYEVVPTSEARQLAAYLLSLRANAPLYSAPISP